MRSETSLILFTANLAAFTFCFYHAMLIAMTIMQTIDIPPDRRIFFDVPLEIPIGRVDVTFTLTPAETEQKKIPVFGCSKGKYRMADDFDAPIDIGEIRPLLQKEMSDNGASATTSASGDGWEAHVRERYAES